MGNIRILITSTLVYDIGVNLPYSISWHDDPGALVSVAGMQILTIPYLRDTTAIGPLRASRSLSYASGSVVLANVYCARPTPV
jgi:hypothetical protein